MIVNKIDKTFRIQSNYPNANWTEMQDVFIVEDGSELSNKIMSNYPYFDFVLGVDGELIDVMPTEKPPEPPPKPTIEEQIQMLKEQQAQMDADMTVFMDYVLGGM